MKPMLMMTGGIYELWLCETVGGALKPVLGTGPVSLPPDWRDAIHENDRLRESERGEEYNAA